ncbi:IST1 [Chionoecetes opilio]|uniref:IST1 n=1 Tax=Chionoecetes opilio TaxID=41210 RepID=A0A8J4XQT5_CHIOP|nr:IST1 [Chionoecetes opilio]
MELNLPNVPGQAVHPHPGMVMGGFNIPPGGPPPADASADALPKKINNMQNITGSGHWDDPMGMQNSPPPEYSSIPPMGHSSNTAPNAPYPSMPYGAHLPPRPQFPPDVATGKENLKDGGMPKPAPRSKFGEGGGAEFTMPDLPSVPDLPGTATLPDPSETKDDIDFDDLTKRFEDLKKKK